MRQGARQAEAPPHDYAELRTGQSPDCNPQNRLCCCFACPTPRRARRMLSPPMFLVYCSGGRSAASTSCLRSCPEGSVACANMAVGRSARRVQRDAGRAMKLGVWYIVESYPRLRGLRRAGPGLPDAGPLAVLRGGEVFFSFLPDQVQRPGAHAPECLPAHAALQRPGHQQRPGYARILPGAY